MTNIDLPTTTGVLSALLSTLPIFTFLPFLHTPCLHSLFPALFPVSLGIFFISIHDSVLFCPICRDFRLVLFPTYNLFRLFLWITQSVVNCINSNLFTSLKNKNNFNMLQQKNYLLFLTNSKNVFNQLLGCVYNYQCYLRPKSRFLYFTKDLIN